MNRIYLIAIFSLSFNLSFGQNDKNKFYEIIWNTAAFESSNVIRDLNIEELAIVEAFRLEDKINIIYLNDIMQVKIFPKNQVIQSKKEEK
jgi:hypothetical protein